MRLWLQLSSDKERMRGRRRLTRPLRYVSPSPCSQMPPCQARERRGPLVIFYQCPTRLLTHFLQLSDFFRFGVKYVEELYSQQPPQNAQYSWNRLEYRPLEGFVLAVSPFNFTAIGGNLAGAPALVGNVVVWKPSSAATYSNYLIHRILLEAGLPPSVIQFVPGAPQHVVTTAVGHREFAGLHFTGSTTVFKGLWKEIGGKVGQGAYKSYPRIVGETGGKNWHLVHQGADVKNAVLQSVRAAFEYQGQSIFCFALLDEGNSKYG